MTARLVVAMLCISAPALAQDPGGPLGSGPTVPVTDYTEPTTRAPEEPWHFVGTGLGVGAAATAFTLPLTVALASRVGLLSASLIGAAVPALLTLVFVPPLVITGAMWLFANLAQDGGFRFHPAIWAALGTHLAAVVVAGLWGAAANQPGDMILLTLSEALLVPAATMAVLHSTRRPPAAPGVTLRWEF